MRTIRRKRKTPLERVASPQELEEDHARWIRAKTAAADRDTTGTVGAADTTRTMGLEVTRRHRPELLRREPRPTRPRRGARFQVAAKLEWGDHGPRDN